MNKIWKTKEAYINDLRANLGSNLAYAYAGLRRIYAAQTIDEQQAGCTKEYNEVGFTGTDSHILSSFAEQASYKKLSPKQEAILLKKMPKYARQLTDWSIANKTLQKTNNGWEVVSSARK